MIAQGGWNFQIHQVIKPVMTPTRYFYDETLSDIPNVYQIRYSRHGSHFTALRILRKLSKAMNGSNPAYVSVSELMSYFADTFLMAEEFEKNLDMLLKSGFVEANNRVDSYCSDVDQVKITNYGSYMFDDLAYQFTYIDLICTDCGIFDEGVANYLVEAARQEFGFFVKREMMERVRIRLERVERFVEYLQAEEERERETFSLGMPENEMFTFKLASLFAREKEKIMASAKRQNRRG
jgi:hypothetical protein